MKFKQLPIVALTSALMAAPTLGLADDDDDELEYEEAYLYFELNDTDGDLGLHGKVDGDGWKKVKIEGPDERKILDLKVKSGLKRQGMTELFFESSEPTFDDLDPEDFFARFPEGLYEWEGKTLDNEEIEGEVYLSQIIPAAPEVVSVDGEMENPGFETEGEDEGDKICWEIDPQMAPYSDVEIVWGTVTQSHFDKWSNGATPLPGEEKIPLGVTGDLQDVVYYEFVAEIDDTEYKSTAVVPPGTTSWKVPPEIIALAMTEGEGEVKFEIIVRVETGEYEEMDDDGIEIVDSTLGNQSAVEDCFVFAEDEPEEP